jgi:hypothetical protein
MVRTLPPRRRPAFTLVEMMVSTALILFMMYILASAFEQALTSFRVLKTAGDMQEKLRAAATVMRQDLTRNHFDDKTTWSKKGYLSAEDLTQTTWFPPPFGYFHIYQGSANNNQPAFGAVKEGLDPDDPTLVYNRAVDHMLQFTVVLPGLRQDQFFLTDTGDATSTADGLLHQLSYPVYNRRIVGSENPSSLFTSGWADVSYYLKTNGQNTGGTSPVLLYDLYRRQKLLVDSRVTPTPLPINYNPSASQVFEVSTWFNATANKYFVNRANDITAPMRRFGIQTVGKDFPTAGVPRRNPNDTSNPPSNLARLTLLDDTGNPNHPLTAGDILLTDVLEFEVKVLWEPPPALPAKGQYVRPVVASSAVNNPDYPFDLLPVPTGPNQNSVLANQSAAAFFPVRVFDTWSTELDSGGAYKYGLGFGLTSNPSTDPWNAGHFGNPPSGPGTPSTIPLRVRVRALQIKLRIWDVKSRQTRQITIIQDV